jgi:hypothetical protein
MFREAVRLGRHAGLVYGLLWEAAWHDNRPGKYGQPECGGTTAFSHEAIADQCWIGKAQVIKAVDQLLDDGLIACLWLERTGSGSWKRRYRVLHSSEVPGQRAAIQVMGQKPSERARAIRERKEAPRPEEVLKLPSGCGEGYSWKGRRYEPQGWEDEMYEKAAK